MATGFSKLLLEWHSGHQRNMPWVGSKDPYFVWLSEIILQQTRVEQGTPYYLAFIKKYPTVRHLASAPRDEVMKMWEGLGYYSRAVNMHSTAQQVTDEFNGVFPDDFATLIKLKGIGSYTAHAILSYAFGQPYAVADGNVLRILSRYYGINDPVDLPEGKNRITALAQRLLDKKNPGAFNQAMMDMGATVCKPAAPLCSECPFRKQCVAFRTGTVELFPVKAKKTARTSRSFHFLVFYDGKNTILQQRTGKDIWHQLYQFPAVESKVLMTEKKLKADPVFKEWTAGFKGEMQTGEVFQQQLTHRNITARFYFFRVQSVKPYCRPGSVVTPVNALKDYSFPGVIRNFLKRNMYF